MSFEAKAKAITDKLSLREKIGQMFLLAFPGKDSEKIRPLIETYNIGGCYLSQDNAETFDEAKELSKTLQGYVSSDHPELPLMLALDQEGAWGILVPDSVTGPGNLALGATNDEKLTADMYQIYGEEMRSVGFNTLLAPCADINLNPDTPIIGTRSFGENPEKVSQLVRAAIRGAQRTGIATTAKHFPGHGDTESDSHRIIPEISKSLEVLEKNELSSFRAAIQAEVDIIMTSHIRFPKIDPNAPATLSKIILQDILRDHLGFKGIIISDSMNMGAMRKYYRPEEAVILAFKAGVEIMMLSEEHYEHSEAYLDKQVETLEGVLKAVESGVISEKQIDQTVTKLIEFKLKKFGTSHEKQHLLDNEAKRSIEKVASQKALSIIVNKAKKWPISQEKTLLCINATPRSAYGNLMNNRGIGPNQVIPAFDSFRDALSGLRSNVNFLEYEAVYNQLKHHSLEDAEVLLVITEDYPLPGEDFRKEEQIALVQNLIEHYGNKVVVLGLRSAYEIKNFLQVSTYISSFSSRTCSAQAAAEAVAGKIEALGQSPVSLPI